MVSGAVVAVMIGVANTVVPMLLSSLFGIGPSSDSITGSEPTMMIE